jgi:predicted phage terminase large subunit-like protein
MARKNQLPPEGEWHSWMVMAGRGFGKTRLGAEWLAAKAILNNGIRCAIVARTFQDVRQVCVEGVSGILAILNEYDAVQNWNKASGIIELKNGSIIQTFSADAPDSLRGPQFHYAWTDELAAWQYEDTWNQLQFGLRLGEHPQTVITTTPRPTKLVKALVKRNTTIVTRGSTFDNADNLSKTALLELQAKYGGTRLGQQELYGAILDDNPGALWRRSMIDSVRIALEDKPTFTRVVVGVDPAVTSNEDSDNTGIVVAGMTANGHYYVLDDVTLKASPLEWASAAVNAYEKHKADRIVAETNNGGDLVIHLLQQVKPTVATKKVTATRGKQLRAEPVAALYEQGRVHHVGYFTELEDEMCEYEPGITKDSPDRMDALVWALTELSEGSAAINFLSSLAVFCPNCKMPAPRQTKICPRCNTSIGETNDSAINKSDT